MWIRSQDKEKLYKCEEIYFKQYNKDTRNTDMSSGNYNKLLKRESTFFLESKKIILGKYKSKKRCLEILNDIQDFLDGIHPETVNHNKKVHQMPVK